jgi:hypothetical protein
LLLDLKKLLNVKDSKIVAAKEVKNIMKNELSDYFGILFEPKFSFSNLVV